MFTKPIRIKTQVPLTTKPVTFPLHPTAAHLEVGREVRGSVEPCNSQGDGWERCHVLALQHFGSMLGEGVELA